MEVALCDAKPDSQSEKKGSKKLNEINGFHEKSNLQCAQRTSSMKDTQMEEPSSVISDLLQVEALSSECPKRKRKKKSSAPIISVGTSVAENCMPIVDSTLHPHVAEFSEQAIEQEVSEPRTEGNSTKTNLESSEPIAGLSCSRKKKGKPKKRCKSRVSQDASCGNDICDGSSPVENIVPGIDSSPQPPASELSEQELNLAQLIRDGIGTTSAEDPRPSADFCCSRKKGKLKKSCKSRDGNDESCGNDICDGTSPVENIISGIDPSQQPPVSEFSEEVLELPHPIMERISKTSSEDPKPTASLSFSQENKKGNRKKRRKTNANKDESCENDEESCGKDKRCDLCVGTSLVDNNMPGRDPPQQAVVSENSKQKLELPQTDMEGISPTSSEGPKPDTDLSSLQEKKKKNRKKRRKTQESNDEGYAVDITCKRNDESFGESKTCNLSLGTSVENIIPGLEPSQQPPVLEFSEKKQDLPHQAEEGIFPTSSEGPKPDADLSSLQEKKKKNRKKRRKTQESNDEGCADDKTCERNDESCGKSKTCKLFLDTSVENVIAGLEPSQQPPVLEFSEQKQDLTHPAKDGISPTSSEGPKPDADLSSLQEKKKKNRKKRRKTQESNDEGCADDKTCERNDESCGEDKTCNLSLGTSLENIIPELDPSQQPPVSEFSKQRQDVPHRAVEGIGPFPEGPKPDADLSSLQVKKKKNRKKLRKTQESEDEGCVDETCERNDESCGEDRRCNLFLGTSVENIMPGLDPSQQPPVSEISVQMQDVMHPARDGISTSSSEAVKPIADSSCSQEKKKTNRKRRRKTNEINDDSCGNDKPHENNDESCGKNKRHDLSSLDNIMPPIEQPEVSEFLEQELELPQPLMVGISTKSSEGNDDNTISKGKKTELTDKKVEVSSLPLLAVKADVDVAVTKEEANLSQISNPGGDRSLVSSSKKKLLILDVNGLLADIVSIERSVHLRYEPDITISRKAVFKRPFCDEFLQFCFDKFNVGVWSSRTRKNVDMVVDFLFGDSRNKLLFCWDQKHCTPTRFKTLENQNKPIVLKELRKLWEKLDPDLPWVRGEYNESNTILLDDSPYKALRNPVNTSIFPYSYHYKARNDQALGPSGRLRKYLVKLANADNVQKFVEQNPFGQGAITETNLSWEFYQRVMEDGVQLPTNG